MSIWGKLAGAAAGMAVGGPIGALIGGLAGHLAVDRNNGSADRQIAFTMGVIALGAKMAKADGVVTRDEVRAFKEAFQVPESEAQNVARFFDLAKKDVAGYESYAKQLAGLFRDDPAMLANILEALFHIATADGILHPREKDYLATVARIFGLSPAEFSYMLARHVTAERESPYDILGVTPQVSDEELRRHYRRLMADNHPDKLIARGLPQEMIDIATSKIAAMNQAYDEIRKERGL